MKKKTVLSLLLSLLAAASLLVPLALPALAAGEDQLQLESSYPPELAGTQISVYNWGEYMSDGSEGSLNVIRAFEDATGCHVNYKTFDNNESLYAILAGGGSNYDVIIPSDYMIQRLIAEGRLQKLDQSKIPNAKYIMDDYRRLYFDPEDAYSIPYTIGMVGLLYNKTMVSETPDSWAALWDPQYAGNILQFNNPRDAFGVAQYLLGQDVNATDEATWQAAAEKLKEQKPLLQRNVMDEIYNLMENGEAALAPYYAGDLILMQENNSDLDMVYPKEGTNFFYDSLCIPTGAKNVAGAEAFINFLLEPEVALANAEFVMYATPHTAVRANPDYSLKDNPFLYPQELPKIQYFQNLPPETLKLIDALWTEVLQSGKETGSGPSFAIVPLLIGLAVAVAVIVLAAVIVTLAKKKRRAAR
ncbi:MAG: spermidine/putrescine ABC transporter substrate-binding protein [Oscillospiraceae bacterium]|jgi:spermidine/putrescine transport system substrate-binding protein|nr:spermidine/putrescine ABC transporter substrate-binding protein [Oscillospiraceae bacterium]